MFAPIVLVLIKVLYIEFEYGFETLKTCQLFKEQTLFLRNKRLTFIFP